jgi:hypothetical protein
MHILTASEQKAFDAPPVFSYAERDTFFQVSERFDATLATLRSPTNRVGLVLTVGYFRATKRFFPPPFDPTDVAYVAKRLAYMPEQIDFASYDATASASRHRKLTLDYLGFWPFNAQVRHEMAHEIRTMVRSQMRPKAIFWQVLTLLETRKTEIPGAFALTELITQESQRHRRALAETIDRSLSTRHRALLDALLDKQETLWQPEPHVQRYKLTLLKRFSQSTRPSRIQANLVDLCVLRPLYHEVEAVVSTLDLTPEGVRYYANSVLKSRIFQVSRRAEDDRHLHLVCFIAHQFLRLHDVLIDTFVRVQDPGLVSAVQRRVDCLNGVHAGPSWPEAVRVRLKAAFPFGFQRQFHHCLHDSVLHGRDTQGSLLAVCFGYEHPSHRFGLVPFDSQTFVQECQSCFWGVAYYPVYPWRMLAVILLGHLTDRFEFDRHRADHELLEVFHLCMLLIRRSAINPALQSTYSGLHPGPVDLGPMCQLVSSGRFNDQHCLTSPMVRSCKSLVQFQ